MVQDLLPGYSEVIMLKLNIHSVKSLSTRQCMLFTDYDSGCWVSENMNTGG